MAALPAALRELAEQAAFRMYVADTLYLMGDQKRIATKFSDIILDGGSKRAITPDEADKLASRLGIKFVTEE